MRQLRALMGRIHPVIGPPGAGKTTALIALTEQHPRLARFSVRDYGLALAGAGHPLGLAMRDTLLRGELLANEVVREEFGHFLDHLPAQVESVAVEGYPRDPIQCAHLAEAVEQRGAQLGALALIDVPDDAATRRVASRLICTGCGRPCPAEGACPACGGAAARRHDDADDHLRRRLREFRALSAAVQPYFRQRNLLWVIDGRRPPEEVRAELAQVLVPDRSIAPAGAAGGRKGRGTT
jgi:adenylate kinase